MIVKESAFVNAMPAPTTDAAFANLQSIINAGQFDTAEVAFAEFDEAALLSNGLDSNYPNDELVGKLRCQPTTSEKERVARIFATTKYLNAMFNLLGTKNYPEAKRLFTEVRDLVDQLSVEAIDFNGKSSLKSRAWYHAGLAAIFANDHVAALEELKNLESHETFAVAVESFKQPDVDAGETFVKSADVPSDVLTGTLYHIAHSSLVVGDYASAWTYLRKAEKIGGNDSSKEFQKLAAERLIESYKDAITTRYIGQIDYQIRSKGELEVKLTDSLNPAKNCADVTAIIPVFNGDSRHFREAVESVANQSLMPRELIVIDDGSASSSVWLLDELELPFDLIVVKTPNGGQSRARNIGVTIARSTYIAYLDQDDMWNKNHLEELYKPFETSPALGWVYSNLDEVDLDGKMLNRNFLNLVARNRDFTQITNLIAADMFILPSASLILKEALRTIGGFDETLSGYEDDDLFVRLFREGYDHYYNPASLSKWRIHTASCSYQERMVHSRRKFYQKLCRDFPDDPMMGRFWVRDIIAPRFFAEALHRYKIALGAGNDSGAALAIEDVTSIITRMQVSFKVKLWIEMLQHPKIFSVVKSVVDAATFR